MIVATMTDNAAHEFKNEYLIASGQGDYVTAPLPPVLEKTGRGGMGTFFDGKQDLINFYWSIKDRGTLNWARSGVNEAGSKGAFQYENPASFYRVFERTRELTIKKFQPLL